MRSRLLNSPPPAAGNERGEMTAVETDIKTYGQLIGGEWAGAADGATYENRDPFTGEVVAINAASSRADAERAIEAAAAAFPEWSQSTPAARQKIFLKVADIVDARL